MAEVINLNMFGGETPQVSTMPTPSAELVDKILQYAGATDGNFTAGYFYKCVMADGVSSWQRVNVQPSAAGISWGGIDGDIGDQTDLAAALNAKTGKLNVTFVVDTTEQLATKTAATGDTAIVKTTGKLHTYGSEAWDGGVNGEYGVIYIGENEQYVWDTTKFVLISTEDAKTLNGKGEGYFAKENEVAKKNGRYPLMNVGSADNLAGGNRVAREFGEDTAGGSADIADGIVQIEKIKGNTIVWNQLATDVKGNWTIKRYSKDISQGYLILTTMGGNQTSEYYINNNYILNHKYLLISDCYTDAIGEQPYFNIGGGIGLRLNITKDNKFNKVSVIYTCTVNNRNWIDIFSYLNSEIFNINIKYVMLIDLTQMFGTGNEPATAEEFERMFPLDYYEYNAGQLLSLNPSGILTDGFNQYNHANPVIKVFPRQYYIGGTYTSIWFSKNADDEEGTDITPVDHLFTPSEYGYIHVEGGNATDTVVNLHWSGKRDGEYEEHWEETRDIYVTSIMYQGSQLFSDGLCSVGNAYDEITPVKAVKRIGKRAHVEGDKDDTSVITDGTNTLYVLDTPIEVVFDELLNLNYRVSDFGTETLLPINTSTPTTTPIRMDVEYGLNVVDTVRNLSRNYLGMTGTQNTFAVIASALAAYGISLTLGDYDETNKYYPVTISGGWRPANAAPASATAAGNKGEYYIDADYFYVCVDDATWKRFALSSW